MEILNMNQFYYEDKFKILRIKSFIKLITYLLMFINIYSQELIF